MAAVEGVANAIDVSEIVESPSSVSAWHLQGLQMAQSKCIMLADPAWKADYLTAV